MSQPLTVSDNRMIKQSLRFSELDVEVQVTGFQPEQGAAEFYLMIQPPSQGDIHVQLGVLADAYARALQALGLDESSSVWRRFFLGDPANQYPVLEKHPLASVDAPCAVSLIGQAPLAGNKVALLAYHMHDEAPLRKVRSHKRLELSRGKLCHQWCTKFSSPGPMGAYPQSQAVFEQYIDALRSMDASLLDHAVRTWIYVRDIDHNYADMVSARNEVFEREGLTRKTHYIASTGIEARFGKPDARVFMDTYSIGGLQAGQVEFLNAADHLGRTDDYGVSFERATSVRYRDRKHIFISGTASINPDGEILHEGDVLRQLDRAIENVDALLASTGASLDDMMHWIVYLRDPGDAERILGVIEERIVNTPVIVVAGAVCRPGWLVEIEGLAITRHQAPALPAF